MLVKKQRKIIIEKLKKKRGKELKNRKQKKKNVHYVKKLRR